MNHVGKDYLRMMSNAKKNAVHGHYASQNDANGAIGQLVASMAKHEGVLDVEKLYDCYVDGIVMVCDTLINGNYRYEQTFVLSVYNSNLETQHGLILRVPRKYIGLAASRFDIRQTQHKRKLKPEVFCYDGQFYQMPEDMCEVYFDIEIHPLQLTHVEITLNLADPTLTKATAAKKVFSFSPTDFFDEDDSQEISVKMK